MTTRERRDVLHTAAIRFRCSGLIAQKRWITPEDYKCLKRAREEQLLKMRQLMMFTAHTGNAKQSPLDSAVAEDVCVHVSEEAKPTYSPVKRFTKEEIAALTDKLRKEGRL